MTVPIRCKKNFHSFKEGMIYNAQKYSEIVTIENNQIDYRFSINGTGVMIDYYLFWNEIKFDDYFVFLKDERKKKLKKLFK
jgi:hypothetical protein